jgi:hypothetical protein
VSVPAIVDAETFERAAKRRESSHPKAGPRRAMASPAPLVGLPKCGHCRAGMAQATGKAGRYRYYKRTTRALRLDYNKLKLRVQEGAPVEPAQFVELAPPAPGA